MDIYISATKAIHEVQEEFSKHYPFLRLGFYAPQDNGVPTNRKLLNGSTLLKKAGLVKDGAFSIEDNMTVKELETRLRDEFGLSTQVSRRSGILWLETILTDKW